GLVDRREGRGAFGAMGWTGVSRRIVTRRTCGQGQRRAVLDAGVACCGGCIGFPSFAYRVRIWRTREDRVDSLFGWIALSASRTHRGHAGLAVSVVEGALVRAGARPSASAVRRTLRVIASRVPARPPESRSFRALSSVAD